MHCPMKMNTPGPDRGSVPFVQRLDRSGWRTQFLSPARQIISHWVNYTVRPCSIEIPGGCLSAKYLISKVPKDTLTCRPRSSIGWSTLDLDIWSSDPEVIVPRSFTCRADLLASLGTISLWWGTAYGFASDMREQTKHHILTWTLLLLPTSWHTMQKKRVRSRRTGYELWKTMPDLAWAWRENGSGRGCPRSRRALSTSC